MIQVSLKKVHRDHLEVLQEQLLNYSDIFRAKLADPQNMVAFYHSVLTVDICDRLWKQLRNRLETTRNRTTFTMKASDAVVLFHSCTVTLQTNQDPFVQLVCRTCIDIIDQQLKSLRPQIVDYSTA